MHKLEYGPVLAEGDVLQILMTPSVIEADLHVFNVCEVHLPDVEFIQFKIVFEFGPHNKDFVTS